MAFQQLLQHKRITMKTFSRLTLALLSLLFTTLSLFAQETPVESPNQVNGPVTNADPSFMDTPFLWVGLVIFGLAIVLLVLRKNGKTRSMHHAASSGKPMREGQRRG